MTTDKNKNSGFYPFDPLVENNTWLFKISGKTEFPTSVVNYNSNTLTEIAPIDQKTKGLKYKYIGDPSSSTGNFWGISHDSSNAQNLAFSFHFFTINSQGQYASSSPLIITFPLTGVQDDIDLDFCLLQATDFVSNDPETKNCSILWITSDHGLFAIPATNGKPQCFKYWSLLGPFFAMNTDYKIRSLGASSFFSSSESNIPSFGASLIITGTSESRDIKILPEKLQGKISVLSDSEPPPSEIQILGVFKVVFSQFVQTIDTLPSANQISVLYDVVKFKNATFCSFSPRGIFHLNCINFYAALPLFDQVDITQFEHSSIHSNSFPTNDVYICKFNVPLHPRPIAVKSIFLPQLLGKFNLINLPFLSKVNAAQPNSFAVDDIESPFITVNRGPDFERMILFFYKDGSNIQWLSIFEDDDPPISNKYQNFSTVINSSTFINDIEFTKMPSDTFLLSTLNVNTPSQELSFLNFSDNSIITFGSKSTTQQLSLLDSPWKPVQKWPVMGKTSVQVSCPTLLSAPFLLQKEQSLLDLKLIDPNFTSSSSSPLPFFLIKSANNQVFLYSLGSNTATQILRLLDNHPLLLVSSRSNVMVTLFPAPGGFDLEFFQVGSQTARISHNNMQLDTPPKFIAIAPQYSNSPAFLGVFLCYSSKITYSELDLKQKLKHSASWSIAPPLAFYSFPNPYIAKTCLALTAGSDTLFTATLYTSTIVSGFSLNSLIDDDIVKSLPSFDFGKSLQSSQLVPFGNQGSDFVFAIASGSIIFILHIAPRVTKTKDGNIVFDAKTSTFSVAAVFDLAIFFSLVNTIHLSSHALSMDTDRGVYIFSWHKHTDAPKSPHPTFNLLLGKPSDVGKSLKAVGDPSLSAGPFGINSILSASPFSAITGSSERSGAGAVSGNNGKIQPSEDPLYSSFDTLICDFPLFMTPNITLDNSNNSGHDSFFDNVVFQRWDTFVFSSPNPIQNFYTFHLGESSQFLFNSIPALKTISTGLTFDTFFDSLVQIQDPSTVATCRIIEPLIFRLGSGVQTQTQTQPSPVKLVPQTLLFELVAASLEKYSKALFPIFADSTSRLQPDFNPLSNLVGPTTIDEISIFAQDFFQINSTCLGFVSTLYKMMTQYISQSLSSESSTQNPAALKLVESKASFSTIIRFISDLGHLFNVVHSLSTNQDTPFIYYQSFLLAGQALTISLSNFGALLASFANLDPIFDRKSLLTLLFSLTSIMNNYWSINLAPIVVTDNENSKTIVFQFESLSTIQFSNSPLVDHLAFHITFNIVPLNDANSSSISYTAKLNTHSTLSSDVFMSFQSYPLSMKIDSSKYVSCGARLSHLFLNSLIDDIQDAKVNFGFLEGLYLKFLTKQQDYATSAQKNAYETVKALYKQYMAVFTQYQSNLKFLEQLIIQSQPKVPATPNLAPATPATPASTFDPLFDYNDKSFNTKNGTWIGTMTESQTKNVKYSNDTVNHTKQMIDNTLGSVDSRKKIIDTQHTHLSAIHDSITKLIASNTGIKTPPQISQLGTVLTTLKSTSDTLGGHSDELKSIANDPKAYKGTNFKAIATGYSSVQDKRNEIQTADKTTFDKLTNTIKTKSTDAKKSLATEKTQLLEFMKNDYLVVPVTFQNWISHINLVWGEKMKSLLDSRGLTPPLNRLLNRVLTDLTNLRDSPNEIFLELSFTPMGADLTDTTSNIWNWSTSVYSLDVENLTCAPIPKPSTISTAVTCSGSLFPHDDMYGQIINGMLDSIENRYSIPSLDPSLRSEYTETIEQFLSPVSVSIINNPSTSS